MSKPVQCRDDVAAGFHAPRGDLLARYGSMHPPQLETGIPPGSPVSVVDEESITVAIGEGDQVIAVGIAHDARLPHANGSVAASDGTDDPLMAEGGVIVRKVFTNANSDPRD